MSSRRESLRKIDARLKALARQMPPEDDTYKAILDLSDSSMNPAMGDRAAALIATQFISRILESAISRHLASDADRKEIFDTAGAPLGTLSARIAMARALGIITDTLRENLDTIRLVRNNFAHSLTHISFSDPEVEELILTLRGANGEVMDKVGWKATGVRKLFVVTCAVTYFILSFYRPGHPSRTFQWGP